MSDIYSSKDIIAVLKKLDYYFSGQKGSHGKYKDNFSHIVIVPINKKEIPYGTFKSILKQMGTDIKGFKKIPEG